MGKYERRIFLDRLVELRDAYHGTSHGSTSMSVGQAIDYAIGLLDDPGALDAILSESSADSTSASNASA